MIQRIQTVWLFLSALVIAATLYFNYYTLSNGTELSLQSNFLGIILVSLSSILCLVALFSFKKRKTQLTFIWFALLSNVSLIVWLFISISNEQEKLNIAASGTYDIGAFIPIIASVLLFLARSGVKKDIKLVQSYDRLR